MLIFCTQTRGDDEEENYEPSDQACEKCNCTSNTVESGKLFKIDCSMKNVQHLFNAWPEEMGELDDHCKFVIIFNMVKVQYFI